MPSRRDQVQSYQFFVQRMTSALVAREPDPEAAPFRRLGGAGFASVMVAVLCLAAVGVYGLLRPGGATKWKEGGAVILEKETGTRYLYREGRLHPVLNYASALLAMETAAPTVSVSRNSLVGTPRGPRIGIPFAPDALPPASRILDGPWTLCTQPARNAAGGVVATTVLTVGRAPGGGRDPGDSALLVRDRKTDRLHLVWHDHRYEIRSEKIVLEGLTLSAEPVVEVGGAWLNALPAGEPIAPRRVADRGASSTALPDARVGQVFVVESQGGSRQYYLAERTRLVPITPLQADVVMADTETQLAYPGGARPYPIELAAGTAAARPRRVRRPRAGIERRSSGRRSPGWLETSRPSARPTNRARTSRSCCSTRRFNRCESRCAPVSRPVTASRSPTGSSSSRVTASWLPRSPLRTRRRAPSTWSPTWAPLPARLRGGARDPRLFGGAAGTPARQPGGPAARRSRTRSHDGEARARPGMT